MDKCRKEGCDSLARCQGYCDNHHYSEIWAKRNNKYINNRVEYQDDINKSIERIPFLGIFLGGHVLNSSKRINEYMGFELIEPYHAISSADINDLLIMAESRGDLS